MFGILFQKILLISIHFPDLGAQLTRLIFLDFSDILYVLGRPIFCKFGKWKATVSACISLVCLVQCSFYFYLLYCPIFFVDK